MNRPMAAISKNPPTRITTEKREAARRLPPAERERLILEGAVRFFSDHGLDGQLRDLARGLGITHALLYHYFPTKQALVERVYAELFAKRWRAEWEELLDDSELNVEEKLTRFYVQYANVLLERDWVRIFLFSGLSDHYITDRYFALLGEKLFPRLVRESRRHVGRLNRGKPTNRELELIMSLHGSIFYMGMRRWVYGAAAPQESKEEFDQVLIHDRVRGYLLALDQVLGRESACESSARQPTAAPKLRRAKPAAR